MVEYPSSLLDLSFHALSDPTRRAILAKIVNTDSTVSELAEPFNMSLAAVSKHLQVLERARLVKKSKSGRVIRCHATLAPLEEMTKVLEDLGRYWNRQLDSLEKYLANELDKGEKNGNENRNATITGGKARRPRKQR